MSITEYQRHQLFTWFEENMGKERATTMMNLVPPVGWGDVATSRDLELHRAATKLDLEVLRADVQHDLHDLRGEMQNEFKSVRHEMHNEFKTVRTEISALGRTFAGWLFLSQAAVIGAVAALLAVN